jgi:hypothetical protein
VPDAEGFSEVVQAITPARRVIFHHKHNARAVLGPREQKEVIGAEVEHTKRNLWERNRRMREHSLPHPWSAPLRGYPADSSGPGYRTARRLLVAGVFTEPADWDLCCGVCGHCRRRAGRSRNFQLTGPRWLWRWWCYRGYYPSRKMRYWL